MVGSFLDWITTELLPGFISFLGSLYIIPGVSFLGLLIGIAILMIVVGAILMRV